MRHILWLMPLIIGIALMVWCHYVPATGEGRETLALFMVTLSVFIAPVVVLDKSGPITGYQEIHTNDPV